MDSNSLQNNQSFFDLSNLDSLREQALTGDPDKKALKQVAAQFESIFTQMLFKSMRKANEAFEDEESPFNASSVKFYRDMHDQQLSMELSQSGALGLADLIVEQLSPTPGKYTPATMMRSDVPQPVMQSKPKTEKLDKVDKADNVEKAAPVNQQAEPTQFDSIESFVDGLWDLAQGAAKKIGLNPAVMVAQAALETGWGKYVTAKPDGSSSHNLFNIKAGSQWQGDKAKKMTLEFEQGVPVQKQATFRAYDSLKDSFDDLIHFLQNNPRYEKALQNTGDSNRFIDELQNAGYATDPQYAHKIKQVLERVEVTKLAGTFLPQGAK